MRGHPQHREWHTQDDYLRKQLFNENTTFTDRLVGKALRYLHPEIVTNLQAEYRLHVREGIDMEILDPPSTGAWYDQIHRMKVQLENASPEERLRIQRFVEDVQNGHAPIILEEFQNSLGSAK